LPFWDGFETASLFNWRPKNHPNRIQKPPVELPSVLTGGSDVKNYIFALLGIGLKPHPYSTGGLINPTQPYSEALLGWV